MPRLRILCILVLIKSLACPAISSAQTPSDLAISGPHPRLLLPSGGEKHIKEKTASDDFLRSIHESIIHQSDKYLQTPLLERKMEGIRLLSVSREALMRIYFLSYAWRMTGDSRYAGRAEREMLNVCAFKDWNPSHFLDVAEMTMALAIGYDWLYAQLAEPTRRTVAEAMFRMGIAEGVPETTSSPENCKWLEKKNNWNPVCHTAMAFAAIAAYEQDPALARRIIARSIHLVRDEGMPEYSPDGNYPEGYTYWNYGTAYAVMLIDALEGVYGSSFGLADVPGFPRTPEYILQMSTQGLGCWAYADCTAKDPKSMKNSYPMFWFASRTGNSALLWAEKQKIDEISKSGDVSRMYKVRYLPSVMLWAAERPFEGMEAPQQRLYIGRGATPVAIMRNHFGGDDEIFAGLKGGSCSQNHSHMDIGSFVMYRGRHQWVKDLGIQDYWSLERYSINLSDRSQNSSRWKALRLSSGVHNIMTFADSLQRVDAKAEIIASGDREGFVNAVTDLSRIDAATVAEHRRGVAIVDDSYVIIRDEVTNGSRETPLRWAMLTPAEVRIVDARTAELSLGGEMLTMKVEADNVQLGTWSTEPRHEYDEANPGTVMVGFTSTLAPGAKTAYTVRLIPSGAAGNSGEAVKPLDQWNTESK